MVSGIAIAIACMIVGTRGSRTETGRSCGMEEVVVTGSAMALYHTLEADRDGPHMMVEGEVVDHDSQTGPVRVQRDRAFDVEAETD